MLTKDQSHLSTKAIEDVQGLLFFLRNPGAGIFDGDRPGDDLRHPLRDYQPQNLKKYGFDS